MYPYGLVGGLTLTVRDPRARRALQRDFVCCSQRCPARIAVRCGRRSKTPWPQALLCSRAATPAMRIIPWRTRRTDRTAAQARRRPPLGSTSESPARTEETATRCVDSPAELGDSDRQPQGDRYLVNARMSAKVGEQQAPATRTRAWARRVLLRTNRKISSEYPMPAAVRSASC